MLPQRILLDIVIRFKRKKKSSSKRINDFHTALLKANHEEHVPKKFLSKLMLMLKLYFQYKLMSVRKLSMLGNVLLNVLGIIGGEHFNNYGGGSQYLCLPRIPKYSKYQDGQQMAGYLYGTEYEVNQYNGNPFDRNLHDHDAPCAVCFVKSRGSMLMMPARNDCPSGWTIEYHGYLMTAHNSHRHSTEFICVDGNPDYVYGSKHGRDGALLYPVEGVCGSLPCRPYVAGRELTCAVCTK